MMCGMANTAISNRKSWLRADTRSQDDLTQAALPEPVSPLLIVAPIGAPVNAGRISKREVSTKPSVSLIGRRVIFLRLV